MNTQAKYEANIKNLLQADCTYFTLMNFLQARINIRRAMKGVSMPEPQQIQNIFKLKKQSNRSEQKILYESESHSEAKPNTVFPGQNLKKVFANPWHG